MDLEKIANDIKEGNKEEALKDIEILQAGLVELSAVGELVEYLKTLDQSKKSLC